VQFCTEKCLELPFFILHPEKHGAGNISEQTTLSSSNRLQKTLLLHHH
jgi:hypothetical protein